VTRTAIAPRSVLFAICPLVLVASVASTAPGSPTPRGAGRWINDGSQDAPRLSVEQAIWAMGGLPRGGTPWTKAEQVAQIAQAGFDGFMVFLPRTVAEQDGWRELAAQHGLALTLQCAPRDVAQLGAALIAAKRMKARGLVAMVRPTFVSFDEGALKIRRMMEASSQAGVPFYLETHRRTITQDLLLTERWAREIPGLQMHADLSHFVISYEVSGPPQGAVASAFDAILARAGMIDGRVGNGEQVQIDIGPRGDNPHAKLFASWWKKAMVAWLKNAGPGDVFVFKSELGPPAYAIRDVDGHEISDRWAQALVIRGLGIRTWNEAVKEAGRGQPYALGVARTTKKGGDEMPAALLEPKRSKLRTLRGYCYELGKDFYLSGQPAQPDYEDAARVGVKTIINVRLERELYGLGFPVRETIEGAGMKYVHIPIGPDSIDDKAAKTFIDAIDAAAKPVMIHGSNGNRLWGMWSLYLGARHGVPVDRTKKVAESVGIKKLVVEEFVRDYLKRQ